MDLVESYARGVVKASDGQLTMEKAMGSESVRNYARRMGVNL